MPATSSPATAVRYRDVAAAVDWLCTAFGFEKQTVVAGENGAIDYAQLVCGRAMLMLAPVRDTPLDQLMKQPDEVGGAATQSCYLVVDDADAHHARAKAAGAEIVLELQDDDFGGRGYTCRDPEGHVWMFGTYDPWQGTVDPWQGTVPEPAAAAAPGLRRSIMLAGWGVAALTGLAVAAWSAGILRPQGAVSSAAVHDASGVAKDATEGKDRDAKANEEAVREAQALLNKERAARLAADKANEDVFKQLAGEQVARTAAERAVQEARDELETERAAKMAAQKAVTGKAGEEALKRIAEERRAREAAERAVGEVRIELDRERAAKVAAEKAGTGALERVAAAEKAAQEARARLERERTAITAAEMAKEFALTRADEERLAREAAERAAKEAHDELERVRLAKGPAALAGPDGGKRAAELKASLEQAQKRVAEAQRAREAAEKAAEEAREQLTREQAAKAAAWKVVTQLTKQLKQLQGGSPSSNTSAGGDDGPPPTTKKARPRPKKTEPDE
jgi:uncharacterized glyoxalase superfamily protein PhnB